MIILEFTEEEVDLIFDYCQDPSGTGPNSKMSEYLDENNLWATYWRTRDIRNTHSRV